MNSEVERQKTMVNIQVSISDGYLKTLEEKSQSKRCEFDFVSIFEDEGPLEFAIYAAEHPLEAFWGIVQYSEYPDFMYELHEALHEDTQMVIYGYLYGFDPVLLVKVPKEDLELLRNHFNGPNAIVSGRSPKEHHEKLEAIGWRTRIFNVLSWLKKSQEECIIH